MKNFTRLLFCCAVICFSASYSYGQWTNVASPKLTTGWAEISNANTPRMAFDNTGADGYSGFFYRNDATTEMYQYYNTLTNAVYWSPSFPSATNSVFTFDMDMPDVSPTQNGGFIIGDPDGQRLTFDQNEFAAKNGTGGANSTLDINKNGGAVVLLGLDNVSDFRVGSGNDLYVDNSLGRVGIGTSAPSTALEVQFTGSGGIAVDGSGTGDARLSIENGGGTHFIFDDNSDGHSLDIQSAGEINLHTDGSTTAGLNINDAGLVDISKSSEALRLSGTNSYMTFYNGGAFSGYLQSTASDLNLFNLGNDDLLLGTNGDDVKIDAQNQFRIQTGGSGEDMIVDSTGNVGIGTLAPITRLHVDGGNIRIDNAGDLEFYNAGSRIANWFVGATSVELDGVDDVSLGLDAAGTGSVYFNTNNAVRRMTILQDGNIGMGTAAPTKALEVVGQFKLTNTLATNTDKQSTMLMDHYSGGTTDFAYFKAQSSSTQNSVNFGGGAGANYAATSLSFFTANNTTTTNGDVRLRFRFDGKSIFQTDNSTGSTYPTDHNVWGTAGKPGGGAWSGISDRRLKKGVREYTDGLDEIMRIEPVFYKYDESEVNGTHGSEFVGIIAQDMQKIAPYTVSEVEWANEEHRSPYKTVLTYDGTAIPYMLINAVKAQQEEILAKDEEIQTIKADLLEKDNQIANLEARVNQLFALIGTSEGTTTTEQIKVNRVDAQIDINKDVAQLEQNIPNPFNENTVINYFIPSTAKSAAMNILDQNGRLIKSIKLTETGQGQLNLKATNLPSGTFIYQLIADNVKIDSKQMISIK